MSQSQNSGEKPKRRLTFYERGPGPAAYTLPPLLGRPSHAVTHRINPNCPIGIKLGRTVKSLGPGPAYYDIEYGQKANGTSRGVAYTMRKKFPPRKCLHIGTIRKTEVLNAQCSINTLEFYSFQGMEL